jgi:hypothetical protein
MAPANETPSTLTRFIGEHFAMVVGGGLVAILTATAFIGAAPPDTAEGVGRAVAR